MKKTLALTLATVALVLGGCATGGAQYQSHEAAREYNVRFGVVQSVRMVSVGSPTGVGVVGGAVLGGIAGNTLGGSSRANAAGAVAGAILGGIIGNEIDKNQNTGQGMEITVRLPMDRYIAVVQEPGPFRPGDRVRVIGGGSSTRVVLD